MKKLLIILLLTLSAVCGYAQEANPKNLSIGFVPPSLGNCIVLTTGKGIELSDMSDMNVNKGFTLEWAKEAGRVSVSFSALYMDYDNKMFSHLGGSLGILINNEHRFQAKLNFAGFAFTYGDVTDSVGNNQKVISACFYANLKLRFFITNTIAVYAGANAFLGSHMGYYFDFGLLYTFKKTKPILL